MTLPNSGPQGAEVKSVDPGGAPSVELLEKESLKSIDEALVQRFNDGDESAFEEIIQLYYGKIFGLARKLIRNAADAEEIAQDTFIRAYRGLANFRGDASLPNWLYSIAQNLTRSRYAYFLRRRRQDSIPLDLPLAEGSGATFADVIASNGQSPLQETAKSEFSSLVAACMEKLEPPHREILTMRSILDLPYEEIATLLGMNVGTVKSRIGRAREKLLSLLAAEAPDLALDAGAGEFFIAAQASQAARPLFPT